MAKSSARSPERKRSGRARRGDLVTRQRVIAGGATAFAIAFTYVTVNAVWYQPQEHSSAFFTTRLVAEKAEPVEQAAPAVLPAEAPVLPAKAPVKPTIEQVIRLAAQQPAPPPRPERPEAEQGDARVRAAQRVLARLELYQGSIDGLMGPQTREAIAAYQEKLGLKVTGEIDAALLRQLGVGELASAAPVTDRIETASAVRTSDRMITRVEAGLKAFGNSGIEIDGVIEQEAVAGLREFQSLFGLPVTGKPDPEVYAKMREIGLIGGQ